MIKQIFKMLWKRRKSNFLLVFQLFISLIALSLFGASNIVRFTNYFRPYYYSYKTSWGLDISTGNLSKEESYRKVKLIESQIQNIHGVEVVSNPTIIPFYSWGNLEDLKLNGQVATFRIFNVDEHYQKAINIHVLKGRWFNSADYYSNITPLIITNDVNEKYFNNDANIVGKVIKLGNERVKIIGITDEYRDNASDMKQYKNGCLYQLLAKDSLSTQLLIKTANTDPYMEVQKKIRKVISVNGGGEINVIAFRSLSMFKTISDKQDLISLTIGGLICVFLTLIVFLGISGVFSYAIAQRKSEIGLRMATGAKLVNIFLQFLGETFVIATFAVIPGVLIAMQIIVGNSYGGLNSMQSIICIGGAVFIIYLITIVSVLYPSLKASKLKPAIALHED